VTKPTLTLSAATAPVATVIASAATVAEVAITLDVVCTNRINDLLWSLQPPDRKSAVARMMLRTDSFVEFLIAALAIYVLRRAFSASYQSLSVTRSRRRRAGKAA